MREMRETETSKWEMVVVERQEVHDAFPSRTVAFLDSISNSAAAPTKYSISRDRRLFQSKIASSPAVESRR